MASAESADSDHQGGKDNMSIWVILLSAVGGALISEMYHARMWQLYRQGKAEGRTYSNDTKQRVTIKR